MDKNIERKAIEAVHRHYSCYGKYRCLHVDYCRFGTGMNNAYDCCECGADEFHEGYLQGAKDKEAEDEDI